MSGWRLGAYELDCHGTLRLGDRAISMKTLQRQALLLLVRERGAMVPRQRLIEGLWPDGPPRDPGALSQLIHGLRQVLERGPLGGDVIRTIYGQGYAYVGPLGELSAQLPAELPAPPGPARAARDPALSQANSPVSANLLHREAWARWRQGNPLDLPEVVSLLKASLAIDGQNAEAAVDLCHGLLVQASWGMVPTRAAAVEVQGLLKRAGALAVDPITLAAIEAEMLSLLCWQPGRSNALFTSWLPQQLPLDRPLLGWVRHLVFSGQLQLALELLEPRLQQNLPQGWGLKAHAHIQLSEFAAAESALRRQVAAAKGQIKLPVQLAMVRALQGHEEEAAALVEQSGILDGDELSGLQAMAAFSLAHGPRRQLAERMLERVALERLSQGRWTGALSMWGLLALRLGHSGLGTRLLTTAVRERCAMAPLLLHGPLLDPHRQEPAVGLFERGMARAYGSAGGARRSAQQ